MSSDEETTRHEDSAQDPRFVASEAAELHAKLIEARDALRENHDARGALLVEECVGEMGDLTGSIEKL